MTSEEYEKRPEILAYRLAVQENRVTSLDNWRREVDKSLIEHEGDIEGLQKSMTRIERAVVANTRVMVGLLATIAMSALVVAFSVLSATGKI